MKQNLVTEKALQMLQQRKSDFAEEKKKGALESFNAIPMPKEKEEEWRYTSIDKFKLDSYITEEPKTIISVSNEDLGEGVVITDINSALDKYPAAQNYLFKNADYKKDKFIAFNASHFNNGVFIYIPKNIEVAAPIRLKFDSEGKTGIIRNLIIAEANSKVDIIEEYSGNAAFNSCVTEVYANHNAKVSFSHLNNFNKDAYSFTNIIGVLERNAYVNWISGCFGGKINRLKIDTIFAGQGSSATNLGIFMGKGKEHLDFTTNMYHNAENTTNDVLVDGIMKDESTSVYRGLIRIPKEGQKTNSYLANHILKLGDKTLANSIPSLKIDANDVKASHGATVGQINDEHLFYLMARGLSKTEAQNLIVEGFFEPIIQKIPSEEIRDKIRELVGK